MSAKNEMVESECVDAFLDSLLNFFEIKLCMYQLLPSTMAMFFYPGSDKLIRLQPHTYKMVVWVSSFAFQRSDLDILQS